MAARPLMIARLAWRESRTARRRLLLYMSSISFGVAALVAIDSFAGNVTRSIRAQARALLGGDLALTMNRPAPDTIVHLLDSLAAHGTRVARVAQFASMAVTPRTDRTRLVQVRAVSPEYPFYGEISTEPAGRWSQLQTGSRAIVDQSLLIALDAHVGDTLTLGFGRFEIAAALINVPGDPGVASLIGPRVFIPERFVAETQLVGFGSRVGYETLLAIPAGISPAKYIAPFRPRLRAAGAQIRTVNENQANMTEAIEQLGTFLGIVGLISLLLGGIGVASGVHAFVVAKIDTVAVLRCLGATSGQVLAIYVLQAAVMGLAGAAVGVVLGIGIQLILPHAIGDFLPVDVAVTPEPRAILTGLGIGVWVALVFALRPLVALRNVSPLQALRRDADAEALRIRWRDWPRVAVSVALVASILLIAIARARNARDGVGMSIAVGAVVLVLWLSAAALSRGARRVLGSRWPYVMRQGIANLYRPANQTRAVVISLGFGAFLISTLYLVQASLLSRFRLEATASSGNLVFFDVQEDQAPGVDSIMRAAGVKIIERAPIVIMRLAAINGRPVAELLADTLRRTARRRPLPWTLRREYRSTFRDTMKATETIMSGRIFPAPSRRNPADLDEVSLDENVAHDMRVSIGDTLTWNVQGVRVPTKLTSTRDVNWSRLEPNFFAVLMPRALEHAPKQFVFVARSDSAAGTSRLQRAMVDRYPNVSSIDLTLILTTLGSILHKVTVAIRFLALFSLAMGIPVLFSAVSATRRARIREGVLLKTLGATRAQIGRIMVAEYALMGLLGSLCGMVLSIGGAWALMRFTFETPFVLTWGPVSAIALSMMLITIAIGLTAGREVFRETAMAALRQA